MDFATGPLGALLSKLGQLLKDEYNLQKGVKKDIEFVMRELDSMSAALRDVGEVPLEQLKEVVKIWARDVRELSYDMEDIVDTFLVHIKGSKPPSKRSVKKFIKKMTGIMTKAKTRHEIGQEIKDIKERVKDVAERHDRYKIDDLVAKPAATTSIDPRLSALYAKVSELVGIEKPRNKVVEMLTSATEDKETKIVSIVGFGGLGKTTLAKAVYENLTDDVCFKAFVPVGQNPDLKKVLKDILIALDKSNYMKEFNLHILDERQLIDELREYPKDKRYFIVIDDIWDVPSWNIIRYALYDNSLGSKIIITTRKHDVAMKVGCSYNLEPLPHKSSQELFYGRIFGSEQKCPQDFVEISQEIIKKCGGVPLAIITTSSLLANKLGNIKEWYEFCESIGSGLGSNPDMENMRKILSLSYYDLPAHLKTCLLYLSIFPEDYEISRDRLIWRWIAEGFVASGEGGQSLFELGKSYFYELINRSLTQLVQISNEDSMYDSCHVHDMVLDLICSISREENFVATIQGDAMQNTPSWGSKVHRLSLSGTTWPKMDMPKLRTLTIFSDSRIQSMSFLSCHRLRVLDLQYCRLKKLPNLSFVGNLLHLRYLWVANTRYAGELPLEIGKLQFLQTLNLYATEIKELPSAIVGLTQLMCLYLNWAICLPNGLRNLTSLEVLSGAVVNSVHIVEELGHLTQLKNLSVELKIDIEGGRDECESICKALVESLGKLHEIQNLVLSLGMTMNLDGSVESLGNLSVLTIGRLTLLPTWINPRSLLLLSILGITVAQVRREDIEVIGMLQALRYLTVYVSGADIQVLERFVVGLDAFPCVRECKFFGFQTVPSMFPRGAMPRLEDFSFCICTEAWPEGEFTSDDLALGHLPSLQSVVVRHNSRKEDSSSEGSSSEESSSEESNGEEEVAMEEEESNGEEEVGTESEESSGDESNGDVDVVIMEIRAKLMQEAELHPNHPSIDFERYQ